MKRSFGRLLLLLLLCTVALQLVFALRIATMAWLDPASTTMQRSEAWRLLTQQRRLLWGQRWVDRDRISVHLQRAVIASEDAGFVDHRGIEWDAVENAWSRNQRAQARAERRAGNRPSAPVRLVGGSTITQQLAKNLLLSGERTLLRKGQELVLTYALERLLTKRRILELYLNHVEWGAGVFGAEAAAQHYFRKSASALSTWEAARLAVMLPRPRFFEQRPHSAYLGQRAATIVMRMNRTELP